MIQSTIKIRTGNQMIAEGALYAGCRFFAGYPITPASGVYKTMIEQLPQLNGVAISAPDEISALAYCVGASGRGAKTMTATSGPGWSLMIETVQYALMTELPVVIALVQRLGPSTGGATQNGQADVLFAEFCTSGGYTIPMFAPSTPQECFEVTTIAFKWAELLRTPVIILSDKEVGMMSEDVDFAQLKSMPPWYRKEYSPLDESEHITYGFIHPEEIPLFSPVGGDHKVTMTGSAHDKRGTLQKNSPETIDVLIHLQKKIDAHKEEMSLVRTEGPDDADILVLSFGITARTAKEAVRRANAAGKKVRCANVISLFPVPETMLKEAARGVKRIIIAEENMTGQYRSVIRFLFDGKEIVGVNTIGKMITPGMILDAIA
ncbi:MAG: transketolase C-terminal domain-containing protein [Bacteroidota bacterium]